MEKAHIEENYLEVKSRLAWAAAAAGRDPAAIKIVVVSKGHPLEVIQRAYEAGIRTFGENYVEEGLGKLQALHASQAEWHMIGHVQSRKARLVSEYFDWVHSLDSVKLAKRLDSFSGMFGRRLPALLECNMSGEQTKFGFPAFDERNWDALLPELHSIVASANLNVRGLMTMAPYSTDPEQARPCFRRLRDFSLYLSQRIPQATFDELSMGMSGDYMVAVEEGATIVRIGTAILGSRPLP